MSGSNAAVKLCGRLKGVGFIRSCHGPSWTPRFAERAESPPEHADGLMARQGGDNFSELVAFEVNPHGDNSCSLLHAALPHLLQLRPIDSARVRA
jgi:hypothetical protein